MYGLPLYYSCVIFVLFIFSERTNELFALSKLMLCFVDLAFEKGPWLENPGAQLLIPPPQFAGLDELHVCATPHCSLLKSGL